MIFKELVALAPTNVLGSHVTFMIRNLKIVKIRKTSGDKNVKKIT